MRVGQLGADHRTPKTIFRYSDNDLETKETDELCDGFSALLEVEIF